MNKNFLILWKFQHSRFNTTKHFFLSQLFQRVLPVTKSDDSLKFVFFKLMILYTSHQHPPQFHKYLTYLVQRALVTKCVTMPATSKHSLREYCAFSQHCFSLSVIGCKSFSFTFWRITTSTTWEKIFEKNSSFQVK